MKNIKEKCSSVLTVLRSNPYCLVTSKRLLARVFAFINSFAEGSNAIPGIADSIFWLHGLITQADSNYTSAEDFFSDPANLAWRRGRQWGNGVVFGCVFVTDLWFVGSLFRKKWLDDCSVNTVPVMSCDRGFLNTRCRLLGKLLYGSLYAVVLISALAEGFTSIPGLALMMDNFCNESKGECDDSSEIFIRSYPGYLVLVLLACCIKAYVDFTVEGQHCLDQINDCLGSSVVPRAESVRDDALLEQGLLDTEVMDDSGVEEQKRSLSLS